MLPTLAIIAGCHFTLANLEKQSHQNSFLIVENDPNDAFLIHRALEATNRSGTSFVCRNASEAKDFLRGAGMYADRRRYPLPNLILTDLRMDGESGIELVEWIRRQSVPLSSTPIIILTGSASPLQFDAAEKVGAQRVYRKPTRLEDLRELLASNATEFCPPDQSDMQTDSVMTDRRISYFPD